MQELVFERAVPVSHAAVRHWGRQVGQDAAHRLRRRRPQPGDQGPLAAGLLTRQGARHALGRAVAQDDKALAIGVQSRCTKPAAKQCFRKLRKGLMDVPRVIGTDQWKSYGAAKRAILPGGDPRQRPYLNHRGKPSPRPPRPRARRLQGGTDSGQAPRFWSA